ncbi:PIN domain-containing protein [Desulfosarcina ovata]|nr:PIN domain-containing protein [Desulfosarcina ovata]
MARQMIERLLDSVIIIDHLNGIDAATQFLLGINPEKTSISVITWAEILVGVEKEKLDLVKSFLNQYNIFSIDKAIADLAAQMRREYRWKLPDAFQAALSINHNTLLTTRNTKDFDPSKHAFVEIPYTI